MMSTCEPEMAVRDTDSWLSGRVDWWLAGTVALLMAYGSLMILSASSVEADALFGNALHFIGRQGVGLAIGGVLALGVVALPSTWFRALGTPLLLLSVVLLVLVMSPMGHEVKGAIRWIDFGIMKFQPSELAKVALIVKLADYLACHEGRLKDLSNGVLPALAIPGILVLLVLYQRDLGTIVIFAGLAGLLLFIAGLDWRWLGAMGALAMVGFGVMVWVEPFRMRRLFSFLDPLADAGGSGYQVVQGWIAMASGGLFGNGMASGLAQQGFLPEAHNDFILAVIGEEVGAVGWVITMTLYALVLWRGTVIAQRATDLYGMLVAVGVTALLTSQVCINAGVVGGLLPAKGLVLPFMSYGASAAVVHTLCIGLLLRVHMETRKREQALGGQ